MKGHQDEGRLEDLDWCGRTNVRCDQLAKAHLLAMIDMHLRPLPFKGWFPMENVRMHVKERKLTCMRKREPCEVMAFNHAIDCWIKKERFLEATVPSFIGMQWIMRWRN